MTDLPAYNDAMTESAMYLDKNLKGLGFALVVLDPASEGGISFISNMPTVLAMVCFQDLMQEHGKGNMPAKTYIELDKE